MAWLELDSSDLIVSYQLEAIRKTTGEIEPSLMKQEAVKAYKGIVARLFTLSMLRISEVDAKFFKKLRKEFMDMNGISNKAFNDGLQKLIEDGSIQQTPANKFTFEKGKLALVALDTDSAI